MKKQIILVSDNEAAAAADLIQSLRPAGFVVASQDPSGLTAPDRAFGAAGCELPCPIAILYQIPSESDLASLRDAVERVSAKWPNIPVVAYHCSEIRSRQRPDEDALKRIGFRAIVESPAQLPVVLRQVEDTLDNAELPPPENYKCPTDSEAFSLPKSLRSRDMRTAFALIASLHVASNQKEAALMSISGIARLVGADRWSIFSIAQNSRTEAVGLETLVSQNFPDQESLLSDRDWQRDLLDDSLSVFVQPTRIAQQAAVRIETIRKSVNRSRVIALPLVSEERVVGVLEGVRERSSSRSFSRTEAGLLAALTTPVAAALANSVRIADAERLSLTDELTRLHNARYLRQFLVNEMKRARRYHSKLAALFLDLDDFKRVNDRHGHLAGSHVLMEMAAVILPSVRDTDCVVRYGGDEFVVILPETGIDEAVQVAERIRAKIEQHWFTGGRQLSISLTASTGVAAFPQDALSPQQLIASADRAMYEAKAANKNCVRVAQNIDSTQQNENPERRVIGPTQFQRIPDEKFIS